MIRTIFTYLCLFVAMHAVAQDQGFMHNRIMLERMGTAGSGSSSMVLGNMTMSTPGLIGDVYLNEHYRNTTFMLYDGDKIAKGYMAKLDLQRNEFDLKLPTGIMTIAGSQVKTLLWTDSLTGSAQFMVNAKEFQDEEGTPYVGFFQLLSEGQLTLLKTTELIFKPADRNVAHSVGSKDNKFIKIPKMYYAVGTKASKIPNKKGVMKLFESQKEAMEKFISVNDLVLNNEVHLTAAFDYYNSLIKK